MHRRAILVAVVVACALSPLTLGMPAYSDWVGVYARIDRVVFEPNETAPERIQIWGAFALASKANGSSYDPAERGYLYYSVAPGKEEVCRKEWADLKSIAGTSQIVGFGARHIAHPRVRKAKDEPADPDVYQVSSGLTRMSARGSDYAPIKELMSLPKEHR